MAATRFYFRNGATAPVSVTPDAAWDNPGGQRAHLGTAKLTGATDFSGAGGSGVANVNKMVKQYVSDPLVAGQSFQLATVKGQIKWNEANAALDARAQVVIRIVSADGQTVRGTLLAADAGALSSEFPTGTATNRKIPLAALSPAALTPVVVEGGDRLVVEIGFRVHSATVANANVRMDADSTTGDLPEDEASTSTTLNSWIEFSNEVRFFVARPVEMDDFGNIFPLENDAEVVDQYGEVSVGSTGLGEAVEDQLTTGVPNGLFAQSDVIAQTSNYWEVDKGETDLTLIADYARPGGYIWKVTQASPAGSVATLFSSLFPVTDGEQYFFGVGIQTHLAPGYVQLDGYVYWFDALGGLLPLSSGLYRFSTTGTASMLDIWRKFLQSAVNPNAVAAHYAQLKLVWTAVGGSLGYTEIDRVLFLREATVGHGHIAIPPSLGPIASDTDIVLAAAGGAIAVYVEIAAAMECDFLYFRQGSAATARSLEWGVYREVELGSKLLTQFDGQKDIYSFTPVAASNEAATSLGAPVIPAGGVWIVIRNTHATSTLVLRKTAVPAAAIAWNSHRLSPAPIGTIGATVDTSTWTEASGIPHVLLYSLN